MWLTGGGASGTAELFEAAAVRMDASTSVVSLGELLPGAVAWPAQHDTVNADPGTDEGTPAGRLAKVKTALPSTEVCQQPVNTSVRLGEGCGTLQCTQSCRGNMPQLSCFLVSNGFSLTLSAVQPGQELSLQLCLSWPLLQCFEAQA